MAAEGRARARILVVDDHEDNIELLRARLESRGYVVDTAADGEQALERVAATAPDLILLDIMLPGESGTASWRGWPAWAEGAWTSWTGWRSGS